MYNIRSIFRQLTLAIFLVVSILAFSQGISFAQKQQAVKVTQKVQKEHAKKTPHKPASAPQKIKNTKKHKPVSGSAKPVSGLRK